jgi:hypothetical protein
MKEVCIVPAFNRPEFLYLCLRRIAACRAIEGLSVTVAFDSHLNTRVHRSDELEVLECTELKGLDLYPRVRREHQYKSNSFNLLSSYREALADGFDRIYLIEEDVMVSSDFFEWQRRALGSNGFFCAIGSGYPLSARAKQKPANEDIYASAHYASIGVGWNRENLLKVVEHARPEYFNNMAGYCLRNFPENTDGCYVEQDGLIGRVVVREKAECAWAVKPKAFHIGYYGSHRGWRNPLTGTWRERAAKIEAIWKDREKLRALNEHHKDSVEAVEN